MNPEAIATVTALLLEARLKLVCARAATGMTEAMQHRLDGVWSQLYDLTVDLDPTWGRERAA